MNRFLRGVMWVAISLLGAGVLRVDVAHGLRDGATALSVGWQK